MSGAEADFDAPLMTSMDMHVQSQAAAAQFDGHEAIRTPDMIPNLAMRAATVAGIVGTAILRGRLERAQDAINEFAEKGLRNIQG
jgi:hypothetical protein